MDVATLKVMHKCDHPTHNKIKDDFHFCIITIYYLKQNEKLWHHFFRCLISFAGLCKFWGLLIYFNYIKTYDKSISLAGINHYKVGVGMVNTLFSCALSGAMIIDNTLNEMPSINKNR